MDGVKLIIRLILKIPGTPILLLWVAYCMGVAYVVQFFQWLYGASDWDREVTQDIKRAQFDLVKRWFTTL